MPQALSSLKILDFSTLIPGPFATMVLADLGAEVIRIEAPHRGDAVRELSDGPEGGDSAWHGVLGRSKRSICLDLKTPGGSEIVRRLLESHDIVVEQFRPGVMARLGLDYETLASANPAVIYCSINSFGGRRALRQRAAHDVNALALAGVLATGARPVPLGIQVADLAAAMNAVTGILAAVIHRAQTGRGQRVEASLYDSALMWNLLAASEMLAAGEDGASGSGLLNGGSRYGVYETSDGRHLALGGLEPALWGRFCEAAGCPDLHEAPLAAREPELRQEVAALVASRTLEEWIDLLDGVDACADPVLTVREAIERAEETDPGMLVDVGSAHRRQRQIGNAIRLSETPAAYSHPGVVAGAHRDQIMAELGYSEGEITALERQGAFG